MIFPPDICDLITCRRQTDPDPLRGTDTLLRHLLAILILLLASPTLGQTPDQTDSKPKTDRIFRKMGLDPVPFEAVAIGLKIHLPELALMSMKPSGDRPVFQINDASEPQMWRMRIESIQYGSAQDRTTPDAAAYLDQVLARQDEHSLLVNKTTGYAGVEGRLCFIERTQTDGSSLVTGWLILPSGRSSFLIFTVLIISDFYPQFRPVLESSFSTIQIKSDEVRSREHISRIENGKRFLESITRERLEALVGLRQWFRSYQPAPSNRTTVETELACSVVEVLRARLGELNPNRPADRYTRDEREEGIMVRIQGRIVLDQQRGSYFDTSASYWMAWNQESERWSIVGTQRQGEASRTEQEAGIRMAPSVSNPAPKLIVSAPPLANYEWKVPDVYLSQALSLLLGRLLPKDQSGPQFFTYYFYNARSSPPSLGLRYDRWEPMKDGSGHWRLATLLSKTLPPELSTYASDGTLIQRVRPTGEVTVPTTRESLLRLWRSKGLRTGPASK